MENINLIRKITWGFVSKAPSTIEFSDLMSVAYLAYRKAEENYNPEKSKFTAYAWHYISGHLKNFLNEERKQVKLKFDKDMNLHDNSRNDYYNIINLLQDFSKEAKQVCHIVFQEPDIYGSLTRGKSKKHITKILRQQGWKYERIESAFNEIKKHLREV